MSELTAFIASLSGLILAFGGFLKIVTDSRTARDASAVTFSATLLDRRDNLDGEVEGLKAALAAERTLVTIAVSFIERLEWLWRHTNPDVPFPKMPDVLRKRLEDSWDLRGGQPWTPDDERAPTRRDDEAARP